MTIRETQNRYGALRVLLQREIDRAARAGELPENPTVAEELTRQYIEVRNTIDQAVNGDIPPDGGLAALIGLGDDALRDPGNSFRPAIFQAYDDEVTSDRVQAVGDLYYIYQHEKLGVFDAVLMLQQAFRAGTVRLADGAGALRLYQYDRRQVLRYTRQERWQLYRRVFGYTKASPPPSARPNANFHSLLVSFVTQIANFFRDKRISEVVRPRASDPSFGSIAIVRRAGLDLRNNLRHASYGDAMILRAELWQLMNEAFEILGAPDICQLFGARNAWEVIEEVLRLYKNRIHVPFSQRSRMANAGRNVIYWLGEQYVLSPNRTTFEAALRVIAEDAEEWLMSAQTLRNERPAVVVSTARTGARRAIVPSRESEWLGELSE